MGVDSNTVNLLLGTLELGTVSLLEVDEFAMVLFEVVSVGVV